MSSLRGAAGPNETNRIISKVPLPIAARSDKGYNEIMDESFLDYLKRVTDEIREIQKNSEAESKARAAESKARMDRFGEWLAKSSAEFDQRIRENNEQMRKSREEFDRDLKKSREEFNQRLREREEEARKSREEFDKSMAEISRNLGGIGNTQGEIAEDLFRRNAQAALNDYGIHIEQVHHNLRATGRREYDIVAVNAEQAVVIEIKTKLKAKDVEKFLQTQLPQFKSAFPEFKDHAVYGGVGALVMSEEQEMELSAMGLFVFTQGEDGIAHVRKPENPIIL